MMDEVKPFESLQADPRNPRKMSDTKAKNLSATMQKFGDLGPVVFNRRNGRLVGGHMRVKTLENLIGHKQVTIVTHYDQPDAQGTVALGYVWLNNTSYAYREVDWPEDWHLEANQAANNNTGEWNWDMLPEINQELLELGGDLAMTGWSDEEMNKILNQAGTDLSGEPEANSNDDGMKPLHVRLTDEQLATVYEAIGIAKRERSFANEPNPDFDANALSYICRSYAETHTSQNVTPAEPELPSDQPTVGESDTPLDQLPATA